MDGLEPAPDVSWLKLDDPWYAEIRPVALGYLIHLTNGGMEELSAPWALTRRGAERKGRRMAKRRNPDDMASDSPSSQRCRSRRTR